MLGNNLAGAVIYKEGKNYRQKQHSVGYSGQPLEEGGPESDDANKEDEDRMVAMMMEKMSTMVIRKQSHREVKGIGKVYPAG